MNSETALNLPSASARPFQFMALEKILLPNKILTLLEPLLAQASKTTPLDTPIWVI